MLNFIKKLIAKIKRKPKKVEVENKQPHKKLRLSIIAIRALNRKDKMNSAMKRIKNEKQ